MKKIETIDENIGTVVYLSKDIDKVAELMDRYGENVTLGGLFERLREEKKIAWDKCLRSAKLIGLINEKLKIDQFLK